MIKKVTTEQATIVRGLIGKVMMQRDIILMAMINPAMINPAMIETAMTERATIVKALIKKGVIKEVMKRLLIAWGIFVQCVIRLLIEPIEPAINAVAPLAS